MAFPSQYIIIDDLPYFFESKFAPLALDATLTRSGKCPSIDEFIKEGNKIPSIIVAYKPVGASTEIIDAAIAKGAKVTVAGIGSYGACIGMMFVGGPLTLAAATIGGLASGVAMCNYAQSAVNAVGQRSHSGEIELTLESFLEHINSDVAEYIRCIYQRQCSHAAFGYSPTFKAIQFVARILRRARRRVVFDMFRYHLVLQSEPFTLPLEPLHDFLSIEESAYASLVIGIGIRYSDPNLLKLGLKFGDICNIAVVPEIGAKPMLGDALLFANLYNSTLEIFKIIMDHGVMDTPFKRKLKQGVIERMMGYEPNTSTMRHSDVAAKFGRHEVAAYIRKRSEENAINAFAACLPFRKRVRQLHEITQKSILQRAVHHANKAMAGAKKYARQNPFDFYAWVLAAVMVLPMFLIMRTLPAKVPASIVGSAMSALAVAIDNNNAIMKPIINPTIFDKLRGLLRKVAKILGYLLKCMIDFVLAFTDMPIVCGMIGFAISNINITVPYLPSYVAFICGMLMSALLSAHLKKHTDRFIPAGNAKVCVVLLMSSVFSFMI